MLVIVWLFCPKKKKKRQTQKCAAALQCIGMETI